MPKFSPEIIQILSQRFGDRFLFDSVHRILYATDASAYREVPLGVVFPESVEEIQFLVNLASDEEFSLIPRTAGTSLAGQVVGPGLIVDVSKHLNQILEVNVEASWVRVQPGVIRDDLNRYLRPFGLYFGPETSTANRAMLGGMVGNNSCGSNSVVYGSTRDHLLEAEVVLSDGSMARFGPSDLLFEASKGESNLQNRLYSETLNWLSDPEIAMEIHHESPKKSIHRRNTGYAVDLLLDQKPFSDSGQAFNFCSLLAGSEGTLCFFTELKLQLVKLPPKHAGLLCIHCESIDEALRANLIALEFQISASELIDHYILECTKTNRDQEKNRFFVKGDPKAILVVEIARDNFSEMEEEVQRLISRLTDTGLGYHFPLISGEDVSKVWALRKAGLGLLSNMPGDPKPVAVIEDTAVDVLDLPAFIKEFNIILSKRNLYCVHYAHAGSGELHLRPIIDLKTREGTELFRTIATDIARLVKKYKGSLSGEHGDGRLRGEFIPVMVGERNYQLFRKIKALWDPKGIFNPGKIVDTPPMDSSLRYTPGQSDRYQQTYFDFGPVTMQQHAEQCNGSGDCRKPAAAGGTMCPSFMATRNEKETTRARANVLREMMTNGGKDALGRPEIKAVMDLCLSCKGCKSECPSNVDVGKLKAEFLQHYYLHHGIPLRTRLIGHFSAFSAIGSLFPTFYNGLLEGNFPGNLFKRILGFAPQRNLPVLGRQTVRAWFKSKGMHTQPERPKGEVVLFLDEFSNFNDVQLGKKAIRLLQALGYKVNVIHHPESGRAFLSKGMLKEAMELARKNVALFAPLVGPDCPLIGIEPSALLSFVDEYPDLLRGDMQVLAKNLSENCLLLEEFLVREWEAGRVKKSSFCADERKIRLHGHCHQKALGRLAASKKALSIPDNYSVLLIPSGCCGMAGSFGYEAEHYELSMQVGELVLFPTIRSLDNNVIIAAPGTSCRHQISDGTKKEAFHPIEVLFNALAEVPEV